jgi:hypothetical protein
MLIGIIVIVCVLQVAYTWDCCICLFSVFFGMIFVRMLFVWWCVRVNVAIAWYVCLFCVLLW